MRKTVSPGLTEEHTCLHLKGKEWQNGSDGTSAGGANIPIRRCPPAATAAGLIPGLVSVSCNYFLVCALLAYKPCKAESRTAFIFGGQTYGSNIFGKVILGFLKKAFKGKKKRLTRRKTVMSKAENKTYKLVICLVTSISQFCLGSLQNWQPSS